MSKVIKLMEAVKQNLNESEEFVAFSNSVRDLLKSLGVDFEEDGWEKEYLYFTCCKGDSNFAVAIGDGAQTNFGETINSYLKSVGDYVIKSLDVDGYAFPEKDTRFLKGNGIEKLKLDLDTALKEFKAYRSKDEGGLKVTLDMVKNHGGAVRWGTGDMVS